MDEIQDFRGFEYLYDARVLTEDGCEFPVHRVLLAMRGEYFCNLFCNSHAEQTDFLIPMIQGSTMEIILEYIYTLQVNLTENNVKDILVTADLLGIEELTNRSRVFAIENLTKSNCVSLLQEGTKNKKLGILKASCRFTEVYFEHIIRDQSSGFVDLTAEALEQLLSSDSLYVSCEWKIWKGIEVWINKFPEERNKHLKNLLPYIQFNHAQGDLAVEVLNHALVNEDHTHLKEIISTPPILPKQRTPKMIHFFTKYFCGENSVHWKNDDAGYVEIFVTYDDNIDICRHIDTIDIHPDVVLHGTGSLFVMFDTTENDIYTFDIISETWSNLNSPIVHRKYYYAVKLGNYIYVIGGVANHRWVAALERYNFQSESWELAAPHVVDDYVEGAAATLGNKIYIVGIRSYGKLPAAYAYDSNTDMWQSINAPHNCKDKFVLAVYKEQLFSIGHKGKQPHMTSVEVYDACRNTWSDFESLPFSYHVPKTVLIKDVLYVYEKSNHNPPVFWNGASFKWQVVEASSPFYDLHMYEFCTIEDASVIKEIRQEKTELDTNWIESSFFPHLNS